MLYYVQNSVTGMLLLVILLYFFLKQQGRLGKEGRYFLALWATNFALLACELCIDILGISAPTASLAPFVAVVTAIFYTLNPTVGVFYFLYIQHVVGKRTKRWFLLLLVTPVLFVAVTSVISIHTGWLFVVNELSEYSRGPYFFLTVINNYLYLVLGPIYLVFNHKQLERKIYSTLLVFPFPVFIAGILQVMFYGLEVLWISLAISLLILFFNVEANQVNRDYLTGLFNRRYFQKVADLAFSKKKGINPQWAFMLDINGFKYINDTFGHAQGDEALMRIARLLEQAVPSHTVVSRYGGDEFALLTPELPKSEIASMLERLHEILTESNAAGEYPYMLSLSAGCAPLIREQYPNLDAFLQQLDASMYKAKLESKKADADKHPVIFHICKRGNVIEDL